ncbi:MAG TPA: hypothetical protein VFB15_04750 [Candidatus Binataceae bacterium]|nr:hypothetical protein [Candidatus Binataceae bacterium]
MALRPVAVKAQPVAVAPYSITTFAGVPPTGASQPDDIALSADGTALWVGYGNGACTFGPSEIGTTNCPTGTPADSNLVEYDITTTPPSVKQNITIPGHLDGLKINPETGDVWTTQDEDGNPMIAITKSKSGKTKQYGPFTSSLITGGFDDIVFAGPKDKDLFITASSQTDTTTPVILELVGKPKKKDTVFTSVVPGAPASVWNVVTNAAETTDTIGDPDSQTIDPAGELVLDNRSDDSLYIVRNAGATNPILRVPLTLDGAPVEVDDTVFTYSLTSGTFSTAGNLYVTDTSANVIYVITKPYFAANEVYSNAVNVGDVVLDDLNSGTVTPVVTGLAAPHGMVFGPSAVAIDPATVGKK